MNFWNDLAAEVIQTSTIASAVVGAIVGAAFATAWIIIKWFKNALFNTMPSSRLVGGFKNADSIHIFTKNVRVKGGKMQTLIKSEDESRLTLKNAEIFVGEPDLQCISDILSPIGKYANPKRIEYIGTHNPGYWDRPYILIGTSEKSIEISETSRCVPLYFDLKKQPWRFDFSRWNLEGGFHDDMSENKGFGIIQKSKDKATNVDSFLIMGHGILGSKAAANFFDKHFVEIGRLFGSKPFLILIKAEAIPESGEVFHFHPKPNIMKRAIFRKTWKQFNKLTAQRIKESAAALKPSI